MQGVHHPFQTVLSIGASELGSAVSIDPDGEAKLGSTMGFGDLMVDPTGGKAVPKSPTNYVCPTGKAGVTLMHSAAGGLAIDPEMRTVESESPEDINPVAEGTALEGRSEEAPKVTISTHVEHVRADATGAMRETLATEPGQNSIDGTEAFGFAALGVASLPMSELRPAPSGSPEPQKESGEISDPMAAELPKVFRSQSEGQAQPDHWSMRPQDFSPEGNKTTPQLEKTRSTEPVDAVRTLVQPADTSSSASFSIPDRADFSIMSKEQHTGVELNTPTAGGEANDPSGMMKVPTSRTVDLSSMPLSESDVTSRQAQSILSLQAEQVLPGHRSVPDESTSIPNIGTSTPVTKENDSEDLSDSSRRQLERRAADIMAESRFHHNRTSDVAPGQSSARAPEIETDLSPALPLERQSGTSVLSTGTMATPFAITDVGLSRNGEGMVERKEAAPRDMVSVAGLSGRTVMGEPMASSREAVTSASTATGETSQATFPPQPVVLVAQSAKGIIAQPSGSALESIIPEAEQSALLPPQPHRSPGTTLQKTLPSRMATFAEQSKIPADVRFLTTQIDAENAAPTAENHGIARQALLVQQDPQEGTVARDGLQIGTVPQTPQTGKHVETSLVRAAVSGSEQYIGGPRSVNYDHASLLQPKEWGRSTFVEYQEVDQTAMISPDSDGMKLEPSMRAEAALEELLGTQSLAHQGVEQSTLTQTQSNMAIGGATVSRSLRLAAARVADIVKNAVPGVIDINLSPEELGRLNISFSTNDAGLAVTIVAERPETVDLVRRNIAELTQELHALGYSDLSVDIGSSGSDHPGDAGSGPSKRTAIDASEKTQNPVPAIGRPSLLDGLDLRV